MSPRLKNAFAALRTMQRQDRKLELSSRLESMLREPWPEDDARVLRGELIGELHRHDRLAETEALLRAEVERNPTEAAPSLSLGEHFHYHDVSRRRARPRRFAKDIRAVPALLRFSGAVDRDPAIGRWLDALPSELGSIARTWFASMRQCGPDVRELLHDGYATACVKNAPFAYVGAFKAHVNVGFFHGTALPDPAGLLEGAGKAMRHVKVKPGLALDGLSLEALIMAAHRDIVARLRSAEYTGPP